MTLDQLALKHGTDKSSAHHNYCGIYEHYFSEYKDKHFLFVELGIGGYHYPERGGESLRMWREYFTRATVRGIDLYEKNFNIPGVGIFQCSQDSEAMKDICSGAGIFIDDGAHINPLTIKTFELVWPVLAPGGIYVIEDIESSWGTYENWAYGAPLRDYVYPTAINLCRQLVDNLNSQYSGALEMEIKSIHFHKNVVVIKKKL